MKSLDLLTLVMLSVVKPLREAADPKDFGELGPQVERMKATPIDAVKSLLKDEFGITWDGCEKLGSVIVEESKRLANIAKAEQAINERIIELGRARDRLRFQAIAGRAAVDRAVKEVLAESDNVDGEGI